MKYDQQDDYNFAISEIGFVIRRDPNPQWEIRQLVNPKYHLLALPMKGRAHYRFEGRSVRVQKGDLLFFPKGFEHSGRSDRRDPWQFCYVAFDTTELNPASAHRLYDLRGATSSLNLYEVAALFAEMFHLWTAKRPGYLIRCRSIIMAILYHIIHARSTAVADAPFAPAIERVLALIQASPERSFPTEELAARAGLSPSYFRMLFKRLTGHAPVQYQNRVRVSRAKDLLISGECNVTEAALHVGFENIYYFSRLFKKVEGVSPSEFLRR